MASEEQLIGKTLDQQIEVSGTNVSDADIEPNRRIAAWVAFEPMLHGGTGGVRVTARDGEHRVLWGFIACHEMLRQHHCPVAVYEALRDIICDELKKHKLPVPASHDPIAATTRELKELEDSVRALRKHVEVKNVSSATRERAAVIARVARDARRMIDLETSSF
jgi:hypothetical protein